MDLVVVDLVVVDSVVVAVVSVALVVAVLAAAALQEAGDGQKSGGIIFHRCRARAGDGGGVVGGTGNLR